MIVNDLGIASVAALVAEAKPPLVVDTNAVKTGTVALERFEPVAGRHAKEVQRGGGTRRRRPNASPPTRTRTSLGGGNESYLSDGLPRRLYCRQAHLSWDSLLPFRLMSHGTRPVLENRSLLCDVLARVHALDTVVPRGHLPPR